MSEELRAAAGRFRRAYEDSFEEYINSAGGLDQADDDAYDLARAYLAEHPADDGGAGDPGLDRLAPRVVRV